MLRKILGISLIVSVVAAAQTATKKEPELTDGREILQKADAAAKTVKVMQYSAVAKGLGADEGRNPAVEGTAVIAGWLGFGPAKYRYEVKVKRPGSADIVQYSAGSDGETIYLVDHAKKIAYADIDPAVLGANARVVQSIAMRKVLDPEAFANELKAEKVELKGITTVGDHECYEVLVNYGGESGEGIWAISKTDFLPRRMERTITSPSGDKGGRQLTVSNLVVNPKLDKDSFKLTLPEGFAKTDEFAP